MEEQEWLECSSPLKMLDFLQDKGSERKLLLFGLACCRQVWVGLRPGARRLVEVAEQRSDNLISQDRLEAVTRPLLDRGRLCWPAWCLAAPNAEERARLLAVTAGSTAERMVRLSARSAARRSACAAQCTLLRDLFGNPFRAVSIQPQWLTRNNGLISRLAQAAYDNRQLPSGTLDPARLAILADALEEAGCEDAAILEHLRGPGPHYRGCFAVDSILGKK